MRVVDNDHSGREGETLTFNQVVHNTDIGERASAPRLGTQWRKKTEAIRPHVPLHDIASIKLAAW